MSDQNSIINLGDLTKPACLLIEKVSDAVGWLYEPSRVVRVARAEAEADKIRAISKLEISDLEQRALRRFISEEARKQQNIEAITEQALPQLDSNSKPQDIADDWICNFFDKCRLVSDADMQVLWARVLAGAANNPGSCSKRTVGIMSSLEKSDAQLFSQLCGFSFVLENRVTPLVFNTLDPIYLERGIDFESLAHLDSIGLVTFDNMQGFINTGLPETALASYFGTRIEIRLSTDHERSVSVGKVILSQTGEQLARVCQPEPVPGFLGYVLARWETTGVDVSCSDREM